MAPVERPYFDDSTAQLEQRITAARHAWYAVLHEVYRELLHRERKPARALRATLAAQFEHAGDYFPWPDTDVVSGPGRLPPDAFPTEHGLLRFMGYTVGLGGAPEVQRRALLEDVYTGPLPMSLSPAYRRQWGGPATATRLKKLANCLAAFARARKRNNPAKYAMAIADWEADLAYLKRRYYEGRYDFAWPDSNTPLPPSR